MIRRLFGTSVLVVLVAGAPADAPAASGVVPGTVRVPALAVTLSLEGGVTRQGRAIAASVRVVNEASRAVGPIVIGIVGDGAGVAFSPAGSQTIAVLEPGRDRSRDWTVCASQAGTYVLVAWAEYRDTAARIVRVESTGQLLTVLPAGRRGCRP